MNSTALREKIQRSGNLDKQTNTKNQIDEKHNSSTNQRKISARAFRKSKTLAISKWQSEVDMLEKDKKSL